MSATIVQTDDSTGSSIVFNSPPFSVTISYNATSNIVTLPESPTTIVIPPARLLSWVRRAEEWAGYLEARMGARREVAFWAVKCELEKKTAPNQTVEVKVTVGGGVSRGEWDKPSGNIVLYPRPTPLTLLWPEFRFLLSAYARFIELVMGY